MSAEKKAGPLRVALVGAGGMGNVWSQKIAADKDAEFVAIVDPLIGTDKQSAWLSNFASVPQVTRLDDAVKAGAEAVVVTAFTIAHHEIIKNALNAGLHVLVEKPFTVTMAEAEEVVALAAAKGLTLMVSQNYRFYQGALMIKQHLAEKRYGELVAVFGEFWCDWPGKPYQHGMQHVMGLEMAVHHFDLCRAMFDAEAVGGYVREWQPADCRYAGGAGIEAVFDMKGAVTDFPFTYSGSLIGNAPRTPWGGNWRMEFAKATLVVDTVDGRYGVYRATESGHEWIGPFDNENMSFEKPLEHFLKSVLEGTEPWCSGRDNLGTMKMALGAEYFGTR